MAVKVEGLFLWLLTAVFALVATLGLAVPRVLFDPTGLPLDSVAGLAEIRAAYFGLFGVVAYLFYQGASAPAFRAQALLIAAIVLGGFTLGRLVSWGVDGTPVAPIAVANLVLESVGLVIAALLWFAHRARSQAPVGL